MVTLIVVLILKYTGALSGIAVLTNSVVMETGFMDYEPKAGQEQPEETFDYNFTINELDGESIDFNQFKGKVVFINLWATWCGPCRVEMPSIQSLYDSLKQENIAFVMLSLDNPENYSKVQNFIQGKAFTFPVYVPREGLPEQLQVSSIPTTFVISKDGKIKSKKVGTANYNTRKFKEFLVKLKAES